MVMVSATGAERLSLSYQPVTKTGAALFLFSDAPPQARLRALGFEVSSSLPLGLRFSGRNPRM
jgi:hypothetical protein